MDNDLAKLRAEAAAAEAEAAQAAADAAAARARAARAALEAAEAAAGGSAAPAEEAEAPAIPADPAPDADEVAAGAAPPREEALPEPGPAEPESAPAAVEEPPAVPEPASDAPALTEAEQAFADAYAFDGPALDLGALIGEDGPDKRVQVRMPLSIMNRHGLVAGATGTGKTRTLQLFAEQLSANGVPVFITDIKGDLTGLAQEGAGGEKLMERTAALGQDWTPATFPLELFALGGRGSGVPIRTTITDFGPLLLSKVLGLNATQESSLALIFHWADTQELALVDTKDLRTVIAYLTSDEGKDELKGIGGISAATAGVILREISALEAQGGDVFFGEPAFDTSELMRTTPDGRGVISSLEVSDLSQQPQLFSTFIMWLLADLFTGLPEVGDLDKPKLVFFFDEAHLLFTDASKEFLTQVVQTVRLIRSKGVGVFFVTQNPKDIPDDVLAQLGSKVQHALRAHTPKDAERLKQAVRTYPVTDYDLEELLTTLGTGEAVVTVLGAKGVPTPVVPTRLRAPQAEMGVARPEIVQSVLAASPLASKYAERIEDPETAYEMLTARIEQERAAAELAEQMAEEEEARAKQEAKELKEAEARREREEREREKEQERNQRRRQSQLDNVLKQVGREITRSIFGTRRR